MRGLVERKRKEERERERERERKKRKGRVILTEKLACSAFIC